MIKKTKIERCFKKWWIQLFKSLKIVIFNTKLLFCRKYSWIVLMIKTCKMIHKIKWAPFKESKLSHPQPTLMTSTTIISLISYFQNLFTFDFYQTSVFFIKVFGAKYLTFFLVKYWWPLTRPSSHKSILNSHVSKSERSSKVLQTQFHSY